MSSSNCCFLTCIDSQEAGRVVWYSHFFKNFLQFVVIHTVKGFGIVNKAEVDTFLELSRFFDDPTDDNLISGSSAFSNSGSTIWKFMVHVLLKPGLEKLLETGPAFKEEGEGLRVKVMVISGPELPSVSGTFLLTPTLTLG